MNSHKSFTRSIISRLGKKAHESSASLLGVRNRAFRTHLAHVIREQLGRQDSVFSDPVIEPTFGWRQSSDSLQSLHDSGRVSATLFRNLTNPHHEFREDYTFPADRQPYEHQLQAWDILGSPEPRSLLVTSGTGSGKTETFMIPILDDLSRQIELDGSQLVGVQALFLYPLNALIESQKSRLAAWSEGMGGKLRFALYTGSMEEEVRGSTGYACEVPDRKRLREAPPPLLITNMTMLEYMLIRGNDAPILEKSQGKLKWIVLDEAHTHIGSNAAEVALLLRRTLHAFGVTADSVRFVATSATFGNDPDSLHQLRCFLADMGGIHPDRVNVVTGRRNIPLLPSVPAGNSLGVAELEAIEPELEISSMRYGALAGNRTALAIRNHFLTSAGPDQSTRPDRVIDSLLARVPELHGEKTDGVLRWLDLLSSTRDTDSNAFLPFRLHLFQRSLSGLSCCVNPQCSHRSEALCHSDWSYGQVWLDSRSSCPCGSPVLSMVRCRECSEVMLSGQQVLKAGGPRLESRSFFVVDEFELDDTTVSDDAEPDSDSAPDGESAGEVRQTNTSTPLLVIPAEMPGQPNYGYTTEQRFLAKGTHVLGDELIEGLEQMSLRISMLGGDMYRCPCCEKGASTESRIFAPLRISATFAVSNTVGTLLETCPPASGVSDASTFFEGRKLIAFNDSRQGTAQLALKVRLQSERAYFRSYVYDRLLREHLIQPPSGLTDHEQAFLEMLSTLKSAGTISASQQLILTALEEKQSSSTPVYVRWSSIAGSMSENSRFAKILELYRDDGFRIDDPAQLASVMLRREFQRRPKNANNLESMGLVSLTYPGINSVTKAPEKWRGDLQDYRDYLKLMMDFFVRESSAVQMTKAEQDLVGQKILNKAIMPPSVSPDGLKSSQVRWPQLDPETSSKRQSRPIRLLCLAFGYRPQTSDTDVVDINLILQQAFNDLVNRGVLFQADAATSEYRLDMTRTEFSIILKAWKCPVTNRLLDTTLKGITPYAAGPDSPYMAEAVEMPVYPRPMAQAAVLAERLAHARAWLAENPVIRALREEFFWSDLSDGVIEYTDFFNAREHSAQVSKSSLKRIVDGFDRGTVNFLSCSTTMEMGVDLSGFNTVMNNNVPPHPANYLQRAGRAGRRRESQAVVMTVARNTPHDQGVFMNPLWAFEKRVAVPAVRFDSDELVLRHVSSWLLGHFLKLQQLTGVSTKLTTGGFLLPGGRPESLGEIFMKWVQETTAASTEDATVKQAVLLITRGTALQGFSVGSMGQRVVLLYRAFSEGWSRTHSVLMAQLAGLLGTSSPSIERVEGETPAVSALRHQISRLEGEFLLKDLAANKVLPTFGFPSDIVTFNNANKLDYEKNRRHAAQEDSERNDSLLRKNGLPSRSRAIAIREYAPGNELVIDGKVYRSAGLTLNWKVPAQDVDGELREQQQLKSAWRCHSCGASDSSVTYAPEHCTQCNEMLRPQNKLRYIVPNGFAVDFDVAPTLNIEESRQMPVRDPWLSVNKPWVPLGNGKSGALRMATDAHLFFHSDGLHQNGYALCLQCGRMDSMKPVDASDPNGQDVGRYLPDLFRRPHRKLRGDSRKGRSHDGYCEGSDNSWKVMPGLDLGHDTKTSALELALRLPDGRPLHDDTAAYTIGLALRNVIAGEFGVIPDEIGVSTKEVRLADGKYSLVQVFDLGSGSYCTSYSGLHRRDTWIKVQAQLSSCPGGCVSSCFNCLLTFENRFKADSIDRQKGFEVITDAWIDGFALPDEITSLKGGFEFISQEPFAWLQERIDRGGNATVCLGGNPAEWDLALATKIRNLAQAAEASSSSIELRMAASVPEELDEANAFQLLQVLASQPAVELALSEKDPTLSSVSGWRIFAQIEVAGTATVLLTNQPGAVVPDWQWASAGNCGVMVAGPSEGIHLAATSRKLNAPPPRLGTVFVREELDGRMDGFGSRFWQLLLDRHAPVQEIFNGDHGHVVRIEYSDRYFRSPLVMALFSEVLSGMKQRGLMGDAAVKVVVRILERTASSENSVRSPGMPFHDFTTDARLCSVLQRVLKDCGFSPDVDIRSSIEHCRVLQFYFEDGTRLAVILDMGFGAWQLAPEAGRTFMPRLDFSKTIEGLSEEIYGAKWFVSINSGGRTYIVPEVTGPD